LLILRGGGGYISCNKTQYQTASRNQAFTLIELLLYTGIFAVTAGLLTGILVTTTRIETRESASIEVANQTQSVLERIQGLVRESSLIEKVYEGENEPANLPCQTFCTLKLRMENQTLDPTFILSDQNGVYIERTNAGEKVLLTSSRVKVNNLLFVKYDNPGGHSTVNVDLTLTYNSEDPTLNQVSQRLTSAIGRVSAASFDFDLLPQTDSLVIGQYTSSWKKILMAKGSAGEPSYTFGEDTSSGVFSPGPNTIGISTNSSERVRIDANGNVGVGTTGPLAKLDVRGALIIPAGFGNAAPRPAIGVSRLPGEIAGVGGGTPTLAYDDGFLRISAGGGTNATAKSFIDISGYSTVADMNKNIVLGTSGVERVRIDSAGNVGVGTASPGAKLEIAGQVKITGGSPSVGKVLTSDAAGLASWTTPVSSQWTTSGSNIYYNTGKVGIGTTSPAAILDVTSTTSGFLLPRMTATQRNVIVSPIEAMLIYNTTSKCYEGYSGTQWNSFGCSFPCGTTTTGPDGLTYGTVVGADGKCWLDRNLGATRVATSSTDTLAYGHLYQWGRGVDNHQITTSGTTATNSSTDTPGHASFITETVLPYDWRVPQNDNLWQGVSGINNPCPTGFRLPTQPEWTVLVTAAGITNSATAYSSSLKLPLAGYRANTAALTNRGIDGGYWSSSPGGQATQTLYFTSSNAHSGSTFYRTFGFSVRCVKD
jgi:uncharacterized protein (TIGR02145 family)